MLLFLPLLWILHRVFGLVWREYLAAISRPFLECAALAAFTYSAYLLLKNAIVNQVVLLCILILLAFAAFAFVALVFERDYLFEYWRLLFKEDTEGI
jgi:hypothetical protein